MSGSTLRNVVEACAALMKGPRTRRELREMCGISEGSALRVLSELRESGLVRRSGFRRNLTCGAEAEVFEWQHPFHREDVPYPIGYAPPGNPTHREGAPR